LKYADKEKSDDDRDYIWWGLRDKLIQKNVDIEQNRFIDFKKINNISAQFNEEKIVDEIEQGNDFLENYSGYELELLKKEMEYRASALQVNRPQTRYNYYKEKKVKEYFRFIEIYFNNDSSLSSVGNYQYDLDANYMEIQNSYDNFKKLLELTDEKKYIIDEHMIDVAVKYIVKMTLYLRDIRQLVKIEAQKNYMKGTYNLLRYTINEYLLNISKSNILLIRT
jgi:glutaredoxin-related protein